jgi:tRNA 2-thiouridine synthesizing protein D
MPRSSFYCGLPGQFNVKILVIVNESPWGGSLSVTALRLVRVILNGGLRIAAIYFRGEGVYHVLAGRIADSGTPCLRDAWRELAQQHDVPLLLCSSASQRRLDQALPARFREAGLAEVLELMGSCDRVVSF